MLPLTFFPSLPSGEAPVLSMNPLCLSLQPTWPQGASLLCTQPIQGALPPPQLWYPPEMLHSAVGWPCKRRTNGDWGWALCSVGSRGRWYPRNLWRLPPVSIPPPACPRFPLSDWHHHHSFTHSSLGGLGGTRGWRRQTALPVDTHPPISPLHSPVSRSAEPWARSCLPQEAHAKGGQDQP
jgi:hypothetical protein